MVAGLVCGAFAVFRFPLFAQMTEKPNVEYQLMDQSLSAPEGEPADAEKASRAIIAETNRFRRKNGLESVQAVEKLDQAAAMLADYMARTGRYGHTADGRRPSGRAEASGYHFCLIRENIAYQYSSQGFSHQELAEAFTKGWKESKGHRKNMLSRYATETGVAVAQSSTTGAFYAVQLFARPRSASVTCRIVNRSSRERRYQIAEPDEAFPAREYTLPARATRIHERCRPAVVTFPALDREVKVEGSRELRLADSEDGFEVEIESLKQ